MTGDIKNFYLGTHMAIFEYARFNRKNIPEELIKLYKLQELFDANGWIYIEIRKGMYGLKQAGKLKNE